MALAISKSRLLIVAFIAVTAFAVFAPYDGTSAQSDKPETGKLVYADFEEKENGSPGTTV